jgi:hypothetical protein
MTFQRFCDWILAIVTTVIFLMLTGYLDQPFH